MDILAESPCHERRGLSHGSSVVEPALWEVEVGASEGVTRSGSMVGGGGVSVGIRVGVGVSLGGIWVLVGSAAWVSATIVNAAAMDVS